MELNRKNLKLLKADIQKALKPVEEKEHVLFKLGGTTYHKSHCELKLTIYRKDEEVDGQKAEFEALAPHYGLKPEDYMREFIYSGKTYQFYGLNKEATVNSCLFIEMDSHTKYACPAGEMKKMLEYSEKDDLLRSNKIYNLF